MKTIEELLDEVEERMVQVKREEFSPKDYWLDMLKEANGVGGRPLKLKMQAHENLLRIAVCINERAIEGWIDGMVRIANEGGYV